MPIFPVMCEVQNLPVTKALQTFPVTACYLGLRNRSTKRGNILVTVSQPHGGQNHSDWHGVMQFHTASVLFNKKFMQA